MLLLLPQRYVFSSKSQPLGVIVVLFLVVVATTKVRIFKQITTTVTTRILMTLLLLLPQRYVFSSKSQLDQILYPLQVVVVATTKVRIFKQITTGANQVKFLQLLLLLPQRYVFSSKSQRGLGYSLDPLSCCCYHKGTYFQANHNNKQILSSL